MENLYRVSSHLQQHAMQRIISCVPCTPTRRIGARVLCDDPVVQAYDNWYDITCEVCYAHISCNRSVQHYRQGKVVERCVCARKRGFIRIDNVFIFHEFHIGILNVLSTRLRQNSRQLSLHLNKIGIHTHIRCFSSYCIILNGDGCRDRFLHFDFCRLYNIRCGNGKFACFIGRNIRIDRLSWLLNNTFWFFLKFASRQNYKKRCSRTDNHESHIVSICQGLIIKGVTTSMLIRLGSRPLRRKNFNVFVPSRIAKGPSNSLVDVQAHQPVILVHALLVTRVPLSIRSSPNSKPLK